MTAAETVWSFTFSQTRVHYVVHYRFVTLGPLAMISDFAWIMLISIWYRCSAQLSCAITFCTYTACWPDEHQGKCKGPTALCEFCFPENFGNTKAAFNNFWHAAESLGCAQPKAPRSNMVYWQILRISFISYDSNALCCSLDQAQCMLQKSCHSLTCLNRQIVSDMQNIIVQRILRARYSW